MSTEAQRLVAMTRNRIRSVMAEGDTVDAELARCVDALAEVVETLLEEDE